MNISKEILEQLCICADTECTKPHTVKELEETLGKTLVDSNTDKTMCPECKKPDNVSTYTFLEELEAYCSECGLNFNVKTGAVIELEDIAEPLPKLHKMFYDGNFYQCEDCTFETQFMMEANQHEQNAPNIKTEKTEKIEKHELSWDKNRWVCSCKFEYTTHALAEQHVKEKAATILEELHYTRYDQDTKRWKCIYCQVVFMTWKDSETHETAAGKKANNASVYTSSSYTKHCTHKPQEVMKGEGWSISAGRRYDCEEELSKFNIVLNLTGNGISKQHSIPIPGLKKWESRDKFKEICLDWPDRGIVSLPKEFWRDLFNHIKNNKQKVVMFCVGGHGRTGTAIASLLVVGFGWEPKDACTWVWTSYCKEAIETSGQINYVYNLAGQKYVPPKDETKATTNYTYKKENGTETMMLGAWD